MQPRETTTFWLGIFISHRIIVLGQGSLDLARLPVLAGCGSLNNLECAACARRTHRTSSETQSAQLRRIERAQARPRGLGIPERLEPRIGCGNSSSTEPGCDTTRTTSGASCVSLVGLASVLPDGRWNATKRRSSNEKKINWQRIKKALCERRTIVFVAESGFERTTASGKDLSPAPADLGIALPLQMEGAFGRRRHHLVELPARPRRLPRHRGHRFLPPSVAPPSGQTAGGLGRAAAAQGAGGRRVYSLATVQNTFVESFNSKLSE